VGRLALAIYFVRVFFVNVFVANIHIY
jgi:hypothetical protein